MTIAPNLPTGAFMRLVQNTIDTIPLESGVDVYFKPQLQSGPADFDPFTDPENTDRFIAPKAGLYEFNSSVESTGTGQLYHFVETSAGKVTGLAQGDGGALVATVRTKLYLEAGAIVRRGVRYQGPDAVAINLRPDSNFYEITYCR